MKKRGGEHNMIPPKEHNSYLATTHKEIEIKSELPDKEFKRTILRK